ncbi:hypothetical protein SUGI_0053450 [Cryptomeria japonica]|nr:hypothetical protein SUGI_0053450 [Cryptomeria japonica]
MIILCREFSVVISPVLKMGSLCCVVDPPCVGCGHAREPASGDGSAPSFKMALAQGCGFKVLREYACLIGTGGFFRRGLQAYLASWQKGRGC